MITTPLFEKYRQGDTIQFLNNLLTIVSEARANDLHIAMQLDTLLNTINGLNTAWQPELGSQMTPEIAALDAQRDAVFNGLNLTVQAWGAYHFIPAKRNAAFLIADSLAGHGDKVAKLRYQEQTATLNSILQDLTTTLTSQVALLGLGDWVSSLESLNSSFDQKYVQRAQTMAGADPGKVAEMVTQAITDFRNLKTIFEARFAVAKADGEDVSTFTAVEQEWNSLTNDYNTAVLRNSGGNDEAPVDNPPTP